MPRNNNNKDTAPINPIAHFANWLLEKMKDLFSPEEVVVTFNDHGYTYKKVQRN